MNANDLWSGSDYAYHDYRPKGTTFVHGGMRVRVIGVSKRKTDYYSERLSAFATVYVLNEDGTHRMRNGQPHQMEVRARDISMRWEDYVAEREHRKNEAERIAAEAEAQKAKERARVERILNCFEEKGLKRTDISVSDYGKSMTISWAVLERWMEIDAR